MGIGLWTALFWFVASAWVSRDTLTSIAPTGTVAIIRFVPNRLNWGLVSQTLQNIPLTSNRPLMVSDLQPIVQGEFALYIMNDGTHVLGVRSSRERLPVDAFDAEGILVQEVSKHQFLLSDRLVSLNTDGARTHFPFSGIRLGWSRIGTMTMLDEKAKTAGTIYAAKGKVLINLPKSGLPTLPWKHLPDTTVAAMATPALSSDPIDGVTKAMDVVLASMKTPSATEIANKITNSSGAIILSSDKNGTGYLVGMKNDGFTTEDLKQFMRTHVALEHPTLTDLPLPDQTTAHELVADPSFITIEEVTTGGSPVLRVKSDDSSFIYASTSETATAISNREDLLQFWLHPEEATQATLACGRSALYANLPALRDTSKEGINTYLPTLLLPLSKTYPFVRVVPGWFHTAVYFTDTNCG